MNVEDYLKATGMSLHALSLAVGISYSTLHPHATKGKEVSVATAKKLEAWSRQQPAAERGVVMTASAILELSSGGTGTDG